ncbi:MAG: lantibiotic dehydratase, partial [Egibacteraceae bacterium]
AVELAAQIAKHLRRTLARWPEIKPHLPLRINPSLTICVGAPEGGGAESPTTARQDGPPFQTQGAATPVGAPEGGGAESPTTARQDGPPFQTQGAATPVGAPEGGGAQSPTTARQDGPPFQTQGAAHAGGTTLRFLQCRGDEAVVEMAATPTLRRVLEAVRVTPTPSYGGTAAAITALDPTIGTLEVTAYLDRLLDVGLLEAQLDVPDQSLDHLGALLDALAGYTGERVEGIRELLERLRANLARLADSMQAHARLESMGAVDDTLHELYATLGWTQRGIEVPQKKAFLEDTLVVGLEYRCALPDWGGVLDDLRLLHGFTGLYDRFLPTRLALTAFFADHYGAGSGASFLDFCGVLWDELRLPARWRPDCRISGADLAAVLDQAAVLNQPSVTTTAGLEPLDRLKQAQRQVDAHVGSQPVDQAGIRRLDHRLVAELVATLPEFVQPHDSVAFYGQPMIRGGTPSFVLNTTDSGFRRAHSRLQRLVRRTQGGACSAPELPTDDGRQALYADVAGIAGSNLNLRISPAPYEITYPGTVSHRPPAERIPLRDLAVTHDPITNRLRLVWRSRGLGVVPLHLGMMVDHALPRAYRLLIQAFGVSSFCGLPLRLSGFDAVTDGRGVRRVPRLCLGNVVIQRATWVVRSDDVPLRAKGESALAYLIRVTRWIREHDIPQQCFVRAVAAGDTSTASAGLGKNRKPCYVDFSNQVFLRVFCQIAQQPDRLLICQEVLPTNDDLRITDQRGGYASECVFELGR